MHNTHPPLPFGTFSDDAQVWIYQTGQSLEPFYTQIDQALTPFTTHWASHGTPVMGAWAIYAGHLLLVAAQEQQAGVSGCSTDGLVRTIQGLCAQTEQDFFNRTAILLHGQDGIGFYPQAVVKKGQLPSPPDTYLYYDISKNKLKDIRADWPIPLHNSWILRKIGQNT